MQSNGVNSVSGLLARARALTLRFFERLDNDETKYAAQVVLNEKKDPSKKDIRLFNLALGVDKNPLTKSSKYDLSFAEAIMGELLQNEQEIESDLQAIYNRCRELFTDFDSRAQLADNLVNNQEDRKLLSSVIRYELFKRMKESIEDTRKTGKVNHESIKEIDKMFDLLEAIGEQNTAIETCFDFTLEAEHEPDRIPSVLKHLEEELLPILRDGIFTSLREKADS